MMSEYLQGGSTAAMGSVRQRRAFRCWEIFRTVPPQNYILGGQSLSRLGEELGKCRSNAALIYGGGSIKKNGIYDEVIRILERRARTWR